MGVVTVRELRQNLSVYLERALAGETFSVTRRGEPVAVLAPLPGRGSALDRLVAEGRVIPPKGRRLPTPLEPQAGERALSETLEELREERR
ncbi:MAG: type II toxin-antitoxin system prevent-host-death family antitoxin [Actinomycetota bacterium]|nr:type II toxin-antitoxin system prevent-host-death family antitoxin [Actinomycetota bacterium]